MLFLGRTKAEAEQKFVEAKKRASIQGGLARFSGFVNVNMDIFPLNEPFKFEAELKEGAVQGYCKQYEGGAEHQD